MSSSLRRQQEKAYRESALCKAQASMPPLDAPIKNSAAWAVELLMHTIREERQKQKLSLDVVAERSGVDKAMLSKLENGKLINAQVDTLMRIARALGKVVRLELADPVQPHVRSTLDRAAVATYLQARKNAAKSVKD